MEGSKTHISNSRATTTSALPDRPWNSSIPQFIDNRPATAAQRKQQQAINHSTQVMATAQLQAAIQANLPQPLQLKKNHTGLPDNLKNGIEALSGYSMDDVTVHYGSPEPAQLQAHAYAQGSEIHVAPGQEKHIPHEAWHVVQQKQGRVKPSAQLKGEVAINDDSGLEAEADVMGAKALQTKPQGIQSSVVAQVPVQQKTSPVQRTIINHANIDGLTRNMDTADVATSKVQIMGLWNDGKINGLEQLRNAMGITDIQLKLLISYYLYKPRSLDDNAGNSSEADRNAFDAANPPGDETGIVRTPGQGEVVPLPPTPRQANAINVRSWQIGDIADGISWSQLARHLQGRMGDADYVELGNEILLLREMRGHLQAPVPAQDAAQVARESLARVRGEIRGALDGLPQKEGVSYRASTSAVGVYSDAIRVGDHIRDNSFWSTSGLKLSHMGNDFGAEGTVAVPKVYYIINGSTGVFVPRFTNTEVGVREVLFKDQTVFLVRKITNYAHRTFFVYVSEINPAQSPGLVTKNPWSGAINQAPAAAPLAAAP